MWYVDLQPLMMLPYKAMFWQCYRAVSQNVFLSYQVLNGKIKTYFDISKTIGGEVADQVSVPCLVDAL